MKIGYQIEPESTSLLSAPILKMGQTVGKPQILDSGRGRGTRAATPWAEEAEGNRGGWWAGEKEVGGLSVTVPGPTPDFLPDASCPKSNLDFRMTDRREMRPLRSIRIPVESGSSEESKLAATAQSGATFLPNEARIYSVGGQKTNPGTKLRAFSAKRTQIEHFSFASTPKKSNQIRVTNHLTHTHSVRSILTVTGQGKIKFAVLCGAF